MKRDTNKARNARLRREKCYGKKRNGEPCQNWKPCRLHGGKTPRPPIRNGRGAVISLLAQTDDPRDLLTRIAELEGHQKLLSLGYELAAVTAAIEDKIAHLGTATPQAWKQAKAIFQEMVDAEDPEDSLKAADRLGALFDQDYRDADIELLLRWTESKKKLVEAHFRTMKLAASMMSLRDFEICLARVLFILTEEFEQEPDRMARVGARIRKAVNSASWKTG